MKFSIRRGDLWPHRMLIVTVKHASFLTKKSSNHAVIVFGLVSFWIRLVIFVVRASMSLTSHGRYVEQTKVM